MKSVNIAELKNRLSKYIEEVKTGTEILVRDRNTPVARIVPIAGEPGEDGELQALDARGKLRLGLGTGSVDRSPSRSDWNAIHCPSGDHIGA